MDLGYFYNRVVNLVAWLNVVSEDNFIKQAGRWFPCCFLLFSLFRNEKTTGGNKKETGCLR